MLFLNSDGTVHDQHRINENGSGFVGPLEFTDSFGAATACVGDVDGDEIADLAVGVPGNDGPPFACGLILGCDYGGYWVLFLNSDGTVKGETFVDPLFEFPGSFLFAKVGSALAPLGDLDGDTVPDLVVGAPGMGTDGGIFIVYQNANGTPKSELLITEGESGFGSNIPNGSLFGSSAAALGDLDGNGTVDLAVGAPGEPGGGAVWIVFLNPDGTVAGEQRINKLNGGFGGELDAMDRFGESVTALGDIDKDGVVDLAVGAANDDDGGENRGAVWILLMNTDGTVKSESKISSASGGFVGPLDDDDRFGSAVAPLGDIDQDGLLDLSVGARFDGDGGERRGAAWMLSLDGIAAIDFEGAGENGQEISSSDDHGAGVGGVDIDGFPASGLTAALFDSDPAGPNAASDDPDLLVDLGNVLVLQETPGQTLPDIYDDPDDDALGGDFVITFQGLEVELRSIDLIDLCPGIGQEADVTLTDSSGNQRRYAVPAGWTEDVAMDGPPGFGTLDLTTLADQPGFVSTATATEDAGFDPAAVVMLDIRLGGSGAVDNLVYDPHPDE